MFNRIQHNRRSEKGFTLVELMIAMTIFTVLVTIGIGSVLSALNQHYVTSNIRAIVDSLDYTMQDMARNMTTGSEFRCVTSANDVAYPGYIVAGTDTSSPATNDVIPASCPTAPFTTNKIIFKAVNGTNMTYVMTAPTSTPTPNSILEIVGDVGVPEVILPPEVTLNFAKSGFTVIGAEVGDALQPRITIRLSGTITYKSVTSPFSIETTVTSRQLDS